MRLIEKKIVPSNKSFAIYRNQTPCLDESWHFHQEFELIFVVKGKGLRFIGDDVKEFKGGELALIGSNLPHLWRNSPEYYNDLGLKTDVLVVQFDQSFLGPQFFDIHEMALLKDLLIKSQHGIEFTDDNLRTAVLHELIQLIDLSGFRSIQGLLRILEMLATSANTIQIASSSFTSHASSRNPETMDKIYQYVLNNYQKEITLTEIAGIANLGISPFCRFFKKRTHKTFIEFLNEVRVGHACKLLIESSQSIEQIAYACGFNSQTNFNRQFKNIKQKNPVEFRRHFMSQ